MVLDDKLLIMGDGPNIDLEEVFPHTQDAMSNELEEERLKGQRSDIEKRILQQECIDLKRQMEQTNAIAAIRRSNDEQEKEELRKQRSNYEQEKEELRKQRSNYEQEKEEMRKQIQDLKEQLEEKEARHDLDCVDMVVEDNTQEECDHKNCEHFKCTACDHHMNTNDELVEHHGVCHCNPQSPLYGKEL